MVMQAQPKWWVQYEVLNIRTWKEIQRELKGNVSFPACSLSVLFLLAGFPSPGCCRYQRSYNYQEVSRTLCPSEATNETGPLEQLIFVDVASMAPLGAQYKLLVTKLKHFQLQ